MAERVGFAPSLPRPYFSSGHVIRDYHAGAYEHAFWHVRFTARSNPTSALTQKTDSFSGIGLSFAYGGESGIRTHVGLHPNGFQDRPVMTASVSLQD